MIRINQSEEWTDKHTLYLAILLRDVVSSLERDVVGLDLWSPRCTIPAFNSVLQDNQFYEYYDQALDFIRE